jgi:hypothetical protein
VARLLWQLLCQAKMEALAGPGREISKSGEATACCCCFFFFFCKDRENFRASYVPSF